MRRVLALFAVVVFALAARAADGPLVLISLDAFRWDYTTLHPAETPRLRELMRTGISARGLIPVFPTNTFPNHYAIATGLYPAHSGMINNYMFDPALGAKFFYKNPADAGDSRWWGGEPIWVTAEKQGRRAGTAFWVGSEAEIKGLRPTYWKKFDAELPFAARLDEVIGWLSQPEPGRPALVTFYLEEANSVIHKQGIGSPAALETLRKLDAEVGELVDRVNALGRPGNFVIVSDHGMTPTGPGKVVLLEDYLDLTRMQVDFDETVVGIRPGSDDAAKIVQALGRMPHASVYGPGKLPARFHLTDNARIPPVWIVPDEGWVIETRARFQETKDKFNQAEHGYDNALPSMQGILIASGPAFKAGAAAIAPVENIHIYNLLCRVLGITPAKNDGDERLVRAFLR